MKVVVAEKPSVARDIAAFLGAREKCPGYYTGNGYSVTWAFGHLVTLKDPDEYDPALKKWSLTSLPFIPNNFELKIVAEKGIKQQFTIIKKLLKSASEIICATDAGREGELIFRYIMEVAECKAKPWKRLWLSSLTDEALLLGFQNMKSGSFYDNLYAAARCRSEADWIVGLNATRNFTVRYGNGSTLWSVGRVQTPVLAMIASRDDEIRHFKIEPFFELFTKYREVAFKWKGDRFKLIDDAQNVLKKVLAHPLFIEKIFKKNENEHPPLLYDLTELQRDMNRRYGMSAADTLQIAQNLYEQKFITYPRTDSRYLTNDLKAQVKETLKNLKSIKPKEIEGLDLNGLAFTGRIINDKKVSDHHAIIPTGKIPKGLPFQTENVFEAIVTRLIGAFYPACIKEHTTIDAVSNNEKFHVKGIRIVTPGWTILYPKKSEEKKDPKVLTESLPESEQLPEFHEGESGVHFPYISEGKTRPPSHYTESTLLGAMETAGKMTTDETLKEALKEKGIGTPATRASIIETLLNRKYIEREGKSLIATGMGRYLIALIQDPNLKSPELTGEWEAKLKEIEQGKFSRQEFMQKISHFTKELITASDVSKINYDIFGDCPKCKSPIIKGTRGYGCSKWKEGCKFVLWKEYKGLELNEGQIKSLLQKKILLQPILGAILSLSENGDLMEIDVPSAGGNRKPFPASLKTSPRKPYPKKSQAEEKDKKSKQ